MKKVVIVRHAKAVHTGYDRDFKRELAERGIDDASLVAKELKNLEIIPEYILSSSATRAITTARIYASELGFSMKNIEEQRALYLDYTTQEFIDMIQKTPESASTLFVFGHNPYLHFMSANLTDNFDGHMPTSSTVVIEFNVENWEQIEARAGHVTHHLYPSKLR